MIISIEAFDWLPYRFFIISHFPRPTLGTCNVITYIEAPYSENVGIIKKFCARLCIMLVIFLVDLMSEVSAKKISASTHEYHRRKSPKTLKIDEFALFRNSNFALLRHPVDESQKYFRGVVPSSRRFF